MFYDLPDQEGISLNAWKLEHRVRCLLEKRKIEIKKGIKKIEIKKSLTLSSNFCFNYREDYKKNQCIHFSWKDATYL